MTAQRNAPTIWAQSEQDQCVAVAFMLDDRWGRIGNRCERTHGHDLPHMSGMRATEPVAALCWPIEEVETRAAV
jgi:hypothetical protein